MPQLVEAGAIAIAALTLLALLVLPGRAEPELSDEWVTADEIEEGGKYVVVEDKRTKTNKYMRIDK